MALEKWALVEKAKRFKAEQDLAKYRQKVDQEKQHTIERIEDEIRASFMEKTAFLQETFNYEMRQLAAQYNDLRDFTATKDNIINTFTKVISEQESDVVSFHTQFQTVYNLQLDTTGAPKHSMLNKIKLHSMKLTNDDMQELYSLGKCVRQLKEQGKLDLLEQEKFFEQEKARLLEQNAYLESTVEGMAGNMAKWSAELAALRESLKRANEEIVRINRQHAEELKTVRG